MNMLQTYCGFSCVLSKSNGVWFYLYWTTNINKHMTKNHPWQQPQASDVTLGDLRHGLRSALREVCTLRLVTKLIYQYLTLERGSGVLAELGLFV